MEKMIENFLSQIAELLRESVLVTSALALVLVATASYLWATGHPVPQDLYLVLGTVIGFFFGAKVQSGKDKIAARIAEAGHRRRE